ncbi:MAG: PilZ domain-containing protein [Candidatus Acidiferrales bacterium]
MGSRRETRIASAIPVIVRGVDEQGHRFQQAGRTKDVSASGARLEGLNGAGSAGAKVEIEANGKRAWFRVQWVGERNSLHERQAGVRCLEPGVCIWDVHLGAWKPDAYDPDMPVGMGGEIDKTSAWSGTERRRFARQICRIDAEVKRESETAGTKSTVMDISVSGCFLEMLAPMPIGSMIDLTLHPPGSTLHLRGRVLTSFVGMGMGVAFTRMSPEDCEKLIELAGTSSNAEFNAGHAYPELISDTTAARPKAAEYFANGNSASPAPSTAEALEAVVRVLFRKGLLERAEVLDELTRVKSSKS